MKTLKKIYYILIYLIVRLIKIPLYWTTIYRYKHWERVEEFKKSDEKLFKFVLTFGLIFYFFNLIYFILSIMFFFLIKAFILLIYENK
jgi:hypothetical protein